MATASIDLSEELFDLDALGVPQATPPGVPLKLDAACIRPSRWANRHEASFDSPEFQELKAEIQDAGGNVQPIKVRPLPKPDGEVRYEVVFGHRRHRACLELGLQVSVFVEEVDDQTLWAQMERENRSRVNLSAWEQGMMYQRALDAGLFPTMLALSQAIGRSVGAVSNAIAIANLPSEVVAAFNSPSEIQFRYAKELRDTVAKAPEAVLEAAKALLATGPQPPAEVFKALTRAGASDFQPLKTYGSETSEAVSGKQTKATADSFQPLKTANHAVSMASGGGCGKDRTGMPGAPERRLGITGKPVVIQSDGTDTVVRINAALLPQERWAEFEKAIRKLLA